MEDLTLAWLLTVEEGEELLPHVLEYLLLGGVFELRQVENVGGVYLYYLAVGLGVADY